MIPGDKLGPYEILAPIGAGGMGEVYRARDTRLGRDVAIKVSDEQFTERFAREARSIAALNHTNICHLYDVGPNYLVMELVEGETLRGPLDLRDALPIIKQLIDGIEAAHDKNIVHRDLKPANIKITPEGVVKILDFGLAKATGPEPQGNAENSPTLTMGATQVGMILGTAAYMSPEQARGKQVDKRSDIWSFGVVVYELLTGKRPFEGETVVETLGAVINQAPDWAGVPPEARRFLEWCMEKDRKHRLQAIGDARRMLDEDPALPVQAARSRSPLGWIVAAIFAVVALALGFVSYGHVTEEAPRVLKMSVLPPEKAAITATSLPAVSPDGRRLAFVATTDGKDQLWVRDLDSLAARALTGTDGAYDPFWSPDSRSIAFFAEGKLKKIEVTGGPALTLCDAAQGRGGTWSRSGVIIFGVNMGGTFRVSAAGGGATPLTAIDRAAGEISHRFPWFLPDGRHFLYTANNLEPGNIVIYAGDLDSKKRQLVLAADSNAVYAPPGYLLFVREGTLMAQPFDAARLQTTGDGVPIAESVDRATGGSAVPGNQFSASQNGVLAFASGSSGGRSQQLTWFDRSGRVTGTLGVPGTVGWGAISPDGKTVAVDRDDPQTRVYDIWLHDLVRGTASRFTFGPRSNEFPVWAPDGSRVAFYSTRDGVGHPFQKATSGTAQDEVLFQPLGDPPTSTRVDDWSRDGRYLILGKRNDARTKSEVWVLALSQDRKPFPFLRTEFNEGYERLSPDGRWLAYTSDESKRNEIYVQSFPTPGGKWQVSTNGGERSVWSRDGKELYFLSPEGKMMAVAVTSSPKFEAGVPKPLFDVSFPGGLAWYDVSKDGRFLIPIQLEQTANAPMTLVINWQAGLKK